MGIGELSLCRWDCLIAVLWIPDLVELFAVVLRECKDCNSCFHIGLVVVQMDHSMDYHKLPLIEVVVWVLIVMVVGVSLVGHSTLSRLDHVLVGIRILSHCWESVLGWCWCVGSFALCVLHCT